MSNIDHKQRFETLFSTVKTVAVLGAHPNPARPSYFVPEYLMEQGYKIYPVNVTKVGKEVFGESIVANLGDVPAPVDMVNVFRRSQDVPGHLDEILSMTPLPKVVWLQKGIRNDEVAEQLISKGIEVVQDRCALVELKALRE